MKKLSFQDRLSILKALGTPTAFHETQPAVDIARRFGVTRKTVSSICRDSLTRAVDILSREGRLDLLLEDPSNHEDFR
jgi:hypothetical protein